MMQRSLVWCGRRAAAVVLLLAWLFPVVLPAGASVLSPAAVDIIAGSQRLLSPVPPFFAGGSLMAPLRPLIEALGGEITWDGQQATARKNGVTVVVRPGTPTLFVDGEFVECQPAPALRAGVLFVPLRRLGEIFYLPVNWHPEWSLATCGLSPGTRFSYTSGEDGAFYFGEIIQGQRNGFGICTWADGSRYEGRWQDGLYHGEGFYSYSDGSRYAGQFVRGKRHGTGVYTAADGQVTAGNWFADRLTPAGLQE